MTRFWIAIALLIAVIAWCFFSASAVSERIETVRQTLSAAQVCMRAEDYPGAERLSADAQRYWRSSQKLLGMVLRHDEADGITGNLAELCAFAETKDTDEFLAVCAATISQLDHIQEMEYPLLENVL
ncbi:MAG: DUF4363 family protein [Oscillospiraceae bacterium]|nr:DUF4363 family protein [Oscillospiraceae bacterium]